MPKINLVSIFKMLRLTFLYLETERKYSFDVVLSVTLFYDLVLEFQNVIA